MLWYITTTKFNIVDTLLPTMPTLEERVEDVTLLDSVVAAYSSSKAIKVFLAALDLGYTSASSIVLGSGVYITLKTVGLLAKYCLHFLANPIKNYSIGRFLDKHKTWYNPLSLPRPHSIGAALSGATYLTGF